jgi:tRNA(Met) C34 N-acetyltransferase TmcA
MVHIRLYREGGRYVESVEKKKKRRKRKGENTIADEQSSTLGVPNFKKVLGYRSP